MSNDRLYPANPNAKVFFQYFTHHWDFIVAPARTKDWQTITDHKLQPRVLWRMFQDVEQILGVRFGKVTRYGMVDVDIASLLHFTNNPQTFRDLCNAFELIGLCRFAIIFSSLSEGVHIYFPLEEEVNTFNLACALRMAVESAGFKVKGGQLELFPNTKTYKKNKNGNDFSHFNGHRLPLQPGTGSVLLDEDLNPYSQDLGAFFSQMDWAAKGQDIEKLKEILPLAREWYSKRYYRFAKGSNKSKSKVKQWQEDTEALINEGFTDFGQTNILIREIGKYGRVFLALEGNQLHQYMVETITSLPGYTEYCRHQHEIEQRCYHWAKIIEPFWWALGTTPTRHTSYPEMDEAEQRKAKNSLLNLQRAKDCLKRLQETLAYLAQSAIALPQKVGERLKLLCETSKKLFGKGFSEGTLKKPNYRTLWHPKYDHKCLEPKSELNNSKQELTTTEIRENSNESGVEKQEIRKRKSILQKDIQPDNLSGGQSTHQISPPNVVRENGSKAKSSKPILDKQFKEKDPTPSLMKGLYAAPLYLIYRTIELVQEIVNQLVEIEIEKQKTSLPRFDSAEEKMNLIDSMVEQMYRFTLKSTSGPIRFENHKLPQLKVIKQNAIVKVLAEYHSSAFSDDPNRQLLVYIQPTEGTEDWQSGIAVPIEQLEPIELPVQSITSESNNIDNQNLSLEIDGNPSENYKQNLSDEENQDFLKLLSDIRRFLGLSDSFAIP